MFYVHSSIKNSFESIKTFCFKYTTYTPMHHPTGYYQNSFYIIIERFQHFAALNSNLTRVFCHLYNKIEDRDPWYPHFCPTNLLFIVFLLLNIVNLC